MRSLCLLLTPIEGIPGKQPDRSAEVSGSNHRGPRMSYSVKEIFYTLQGEGAQTGRAAVFCRFVGCNLWSGQEKDRANAICKFCDTDFLGTDGPDGGKVATETALADRIEQTCASGSPSAN